jgi:hypothetical protein
VSNLARNNRSGPSLDDFAAIHHLDAALIAAADTVCDHIAYGHRTVADVVQLRRPLHAA